MVGAPFVLDLTLSTAPAGLLRLRARRADAGGGECPRIANALLGERIEVGRHRHAIPERAHAGAHVLRHQQQDVRPLRYLCERGLR